MKTGRKIVLLVAVHTAVWLIFLSLPTLFNPRRTDFSLSEFAADLMEPPRWTNGLLLVTIFYFNYCFAIPRLYLSRRYALLFISFVAWFAVFFILNIAMRPGSGHIPSADLDFPDSPGMHFFGNSFNLFMFIIVYAVSFAARIYEQYHQMRQQMLNTQIAFLKAQINPHFLFNTLNSIYSLSLTQSEEAPEAVLMLSGMMRYSVSDAGQQQVSLAKELDYINNYIALQKLRLPAAARLKYEVQGEALGKQIAPFLLIPFVENAFKYGVNPDEVSDITIDINVSGSAIELRVSNNKVFLSADSYRSAGLGINTTRTRLEAIYPRRHVLTINDNAVTFNVLLQIQLL